MLILAHMYRLHWHFSTSYLINPVFIQVGLRLGAERFYSYFEQFELLKKTGIDLPGEARTIMHDPKKIGEVELATISFGQSFQLTTLRLLTTMR